MNDSFDNWFSKLSKKIKQVEPERDQSVSAIWNDRGLNLNNQKNYEEAIVNFEKAIQLDPSNPAPWFNKAMAEEQLGKWQDSEKSYRQFIKLNPNLDIRQTEEVLRRIIQVSEKSGKPLVFPPLTKSHTPVEKGLWTDQDLNTFSEIVTVLETGEFHMTYNQTGDFLWHTLGAETEVSRESRVEAAQQLGKIGGITAGRILLNFRAEPEGDVKKAVEQSLRMITKELFHQIPDSDQLPGEIYERLDKASLLFSHRDIQYALETAGERALPFISYRLTKGDIDGKIECLSTLGKIKTDDAARILLQYITSPEQRLVTAAINALTENGSPISEEPLQQLLQKEPDRKARRRLLRTILAAHRQGSESERFLEIIAGALVDTDLEARKAVTEFLLANEETAQKLRDQLGEATAVCEKLISWLKDQNADTHYNAIRGLGVIGKTTDIPVLEGARRKTGDSAAEIKKAISKIRIREERPSSDEIELPGISDPEKEISRSGQEKDISQTQLPKGDPQPISAYKIGEIIGQMFEIQRVLGKGGFGIVYQVYGRETGGIYALKTFQDELLADREVKRRFQKEAGIWVELGSHPYLVSAYYVADVAGRLYIEMEYIAPNNEGLNTLEGYLQHQTPDLAQSLRWAIQICHGMEYAYSKGLRAHRDLKPANIMINQEKAVKITDFGLAGVINEFPGINGSNIAAQEGKTMARIGFGTPTHMAPEQFNNAAGCDERSDIYSFGIILYQMATGGRVPFIAPVDVDFWQAMQRHHAMSPVPRVASPLFAIIQHCLEKSPKKRYQTFKEVRRNLEPLLKQQTGEVINPQLSEKLGSQDWSNKGMSLENLGRHEEAIRCLDKALELDPSNYTAWNNKGISLANLGRNEEAIQCLDKSLEINPGYVNAWNNKGNCLYRLNRYDEAVHCFDKAIALDPCHLNAWNNKGVNLNCLSRFTEAISCLNKALELDSRYLYAWNNKGDSLNSLSRYQEAIVCFNRALELDPHQGVVWFNKAKAEDGLGHKQDAIHDFHQFLENASSEYVKQIEYARNRLRLLEIR